MDSIIVHWWSFPPYLENPNNASIPQTAPTDWHLTNITGVFSLVLNDVFRTCLRNTSNVTVLSDLLTNPRSFEEPPQGLNSTTDLHLYAPYSTDGQGVSYLEVPAASDSDFVGLVESPGSVFFYVSEEEPVGSDLLTVILQGWPMLVLILLGAGYSGIIIWILDRLWNPTNFPKPFIRGFWEGFWWAFVTMTTVGYGDTTPRSFQARIYGLVWIVVGITILSVFTATVTTVLTQESFAQRQSLFGSEVGVVNGTEDYRLAVNNGGKPVVFATFEDLVATARERQIHSAVYDQFAFSTEQTLLVDDFLVESTLSRTTIHGVLLVGPQSQTRSCMEARLKKQRGLAYRELMENLSHFTIKTSSASSTTQDLFQAKTITYMWYGMAVWFSIFMAFVLWEFLYWRPKHKKRKEMKKKIQIDRKYDSADDDDDDDDKSVDSHSTSCFPKRPGTGYTSKQMQAIIRMADAHEAQQAAIKEADVVISNDRAASVQPTYNNKNKSGLSEIGDLESLIRRQKKEVRSLEEELSGYKTQWETRLKDIKRQHREERRKLLRLMDHEDMIRNETTQQPHEPQQQQHRHHNRNRKPATAQHSPLNTVSQPPTKNTNYGKNVLLHPSGSALPFEEPGYELPFDDNSIVSSI